MALAARACTFSVPVVLSVLLAALICGCGRKETPVETPPQKAPLRPSDLVNTCAAITLDNEPKGTGFFVSHYGVGAPTTYFVTARHIAEALAPAFEQWPRLDLRVKKQGTSTAGSVFVPLQQGKGKTFWVQHPSAKVDLAVFPVPDFQRLAQEGFDIRPIVFTSGGKRNAQGLYERQDFLFADTPGFLTRPHRERYRIEPGFEVFALGVSPELVKYAAGSEFLLTLRKGVIAAMPACEFNYRYGLTRLIVLDCTVVGGNSGGPVFAWVASQNPDGSAGNATPHLLGIVSSFLKDREIYLPSEKVPFLENSGFSFATPVDDLAEILCGLDVSR